MAFQVAGRPELLSTLTTLPEELVGVVRQVVLQVGVAGEALLTVGAVIGVLPGVTVHVHFVSIHRREAATANSALVVFTRKLLRLVGCERL